MRIAKINIFCLVSYMSLFLVAFFHATIFQLISFYFYIFRHFECFYTYAHFSGRIKVTFLYLDLEHGFDYVEISDGKID